MSRDPGRHTVTLVPADIAVKQAVRRPDDALANPDNDGLFDAGLSLWPMGAAWGSPDGMAVSASSVLARLTRVLIDPFTVLYQRAWRLAREATVDGVSELLPAWERDYGLPGPCVAEDQTTGERLAALAAKVLSARVITPREFVLLALQYGFEVAIEEPCLFECGFSEVGGEHECGAAEEEVYFIVRVRDLRVDYFTTGESELGNDRLFSLGASALLICIIRQLAPAWTIPVLGPWRYFGEQDELSGPIIFGGSGYRLAGGYDP
jgi:uncharacterized protein YmfQ (DUF2313 family)